MCHQSPHGCPPRAAGLLAGLAALTVVLLMPVSPLLALGLTSHDTHACCQIDQTEEHERCVTGAGPTAHQEESSKRCGCHVVPADGALPTEAVALTSTTISFGAPVPAQSNAQVDIPLAREPDEAEPTRHLHIKATTSPLYLLNSVLLL